MLQPVRAAIVDYGLGNLFSVRHACRAVGLETIETCDRRELCSADAIVLPGVGAFGDAMNNLHRRDLVQPLRDLALAGKPLLGICLGFQLLLGESCEFGRHRGLGLIDGEVTRFGRPRGPRGALKVPQVGWNRIHPAAHADGAPSAPDGPAAQGVLAWVGTPLEGLTEGAYLYFVHSYCVRPAVAGVELSRTRYGDEEFCSSIARGNLFGCQFHPERSGPLGIHIYRNFAALVRGQHNREGRHAA